MISGVSLSINIEYKMAKEYTTKTASLKAVTADIRKLEAKLLDADKISIKGTDITELMGGNSATLDGNNVFTGYNTFSSGVQALPLGTKTALGADAYGLHVSSTRSWC